MCGHAGCRSRRGNGVKVVMNLRINSNRQSQGQRLPLGFSIGLLVVLAAAGVTRSGQASSTLTQEATGGANSSQQFTPASADTCAGATVINPASLPFTEDSTLANAANDIDPGIAGCAPGAGKDVVYSFTPSATDIYTVGVTPVSSFDPSLYIVTDCSNQAGPCVAGSNANGFDRGQSVSPTLIAGTRYFIVVDTPAFDNNAGAFHFALRRGLV